jgi:hypothetical protein
MNFGVSLYDKKDLYWEILNFLQTQFCFDINETKFNVFQVPGDGNCFFHSFSFILNRDFSMSNNYRQLICTFILQNWASWEDRIPGQKEL